MTSEHPTSRPQSSRGRPSSKRSNQSLHSNKARASQLSEETTPLLSRQEDADRPPSSHLANGAPGSPATTSLRSLQEGFEGKAKGQHRLASILALSILSL